MCLRAYVFVAVHLRAHVCSWYLLCVYVCKCVVECECVCLFTIHLLCLFNLYKSMHFAVLNVDPKRYLGQVMKEREKRRT